MDRNGLLLVISGPSGAGKGTVVESLTANNNYCLSISATTRQPRDYETLDKHYFFKTKEQFAGMIENGEFLEYAEFCGNFYGTPKDYVEGQISSGKCVILEIEVVGALKVKQVYPDSVLVFLTPPSIAELKNRLVSRNTEDETRINMRLKRAREEFEILGEYDYVVINNTVSDAARCIDLIVEAEKMKAKRNLTLINILKGDE